MSSFRIRILVLLALFGLFAPFALVGAADSEGEIAQKKDAMTISQAAILGVVEGITEYLPVSSTGHLLLAERIMGIGGGAFSSAEDEQRTKDAIEAYTICIQAGAIIAVLGLYFRRVGQMLAGIGGRDRVGRRISINVIVAFLPAALIGVLFNSQIKALLFGPWPVVVAWFVGGVLILAVHWWSKRRPAAVLAGLSLEQASWRMALLIGLAQCLAMWPGVSRSLVTIVGGVLAGMSLPAAVEFSFLLGVLTLGAATAYDALKHGQVMLETFTLTSLAVGLISAFFAAVVAIRWMVSYLNKHGLAIFGYYRVALAMVVALLLYRGII